MAKKSKDTPNFSSEEQEAEFWAKQDSTEYVDWGKATRVRLPKLKPSTRTISLRLPQSLLDDLKIMANKRDVPYQSLIKMLLADSVEKR